MNRRFSFNNTGLGAGLADRPLMFFADIDAPNDQLIPTRVAPNPPIKTIRVPIHQNLFHLAPCANLVTGNNLNRIAFFYSLHSAISSKYNEHSSS
jgi:hypothetical protein